jgi:hypothetical protein
MATVHPFQTTRGRRLALGIAHADAKEVIGMQPAHGTSAGIAADNDVTIGDVWREFGDRWQITGITAGYRAVIRETGGHTPIPRYGRTPAELAESIRVVEGQ